MRETYEMCRAGGTSWRGLRTTVLMKLRDFCPSTEVTKNETLLTQIHKAIRINYLSYKSLDY